MIQSKKSYRNKIFAFIGILFFIATPVFASIEISDGSVKALYHLEDTADASGNGYNATNVGSAVFNAAKLGNGLQSDTGQYLTATSSIINWNGNWTISFWFHKLSGTSYAQLGGQSGGGKGVVMDYNYDAVGKLGCSKIGVATTLGYTWTDDTNYHLFTCSQTSAGQVLFLDGTRVASNSDTANAVNPGYPIGLGANLNNGTSDKAFHGHLDEILILNRATTSTEVSTWYNSGSGVEFCVSVGCGGGSSTSTASSTTFQRFMSPELDQLLRYLLEAGVVALVAWLVIKLFR